MKRARIDFIVFFFIIVTLLLYALFGGSLHQTLQNQQVTIGDKAQSIIETQSNTETTRFDFRILADRAAQRALTRFVSSAGLDSSPCGRSGSTVYWNTPNMTCLPEQYDTLAALEREELANDIRAFDTIHKTNIADIQYEYYVDGSRIIGMPDKPQTFAISSINEPIDVKLFGYTFDRVEGGVRANIGAYYWMPIIDIHASTGVEQLETLKTIYTVIQTHCTQLARANQTDCIDYQFNLANVSAEITPMPDNYYAITTPSMVTIGSRTYPPFRIGIYVAPPAMAMTT